MAVTYEPIATVTLASSSSGQIFFSSIPATYTDLRIIFTTTSQASIYGYFNNDTAANYSGIYLLSNGTGLFTTAQTSFSYDPFGGAAGTTYPSVNIIDIMSYAGSTYKTALAYSSTDQAGSGSVRVTTTSWRSTAAITSIGFVPYISGTYQAGTTATLYGIKAA